MRVSLLILLLAPALLAQIRGRIVFDSKGVAGLTVRLTETWTGTALGLPSGQDVVTGSDGSFSFPNVRRGPSYTLIVRGFLKPGEIDLFTTVGDKELGGAPLRIELLKPIEFTRPAYGAYLADRSVAIAWKPLAEAARYVLRVEGLPRKRTLPFSAGQTEARLDLSPGLQCVYIQAYSAGNVEVGGSILPQGAAYASPNRCFVVADPEVERKTVAAKGVCTMRADIVAVYVKPSRAESDRASFVLLKDEKAILLGQFTGWRKLDSPRGVGWVSSADLECAN